MKRVGRVEQSSLFGLSFYNEDKKVFKSPGANIRNFFVRNLRVFVKSLVFIPHKLFKPSLTNTLAYFENS
jgi:hypothetical protein